MAADKMKILSLYKQMLRTSQKFCSYNFRTYALRRTRDGFQEGKHESDPAKIAALVKKAEENLEIINRQTLISQLYKEPVQVIEGMQAKKSVNHN